MAMASRSGRRCRRGDGELIARRRHQSAKARNIDLRAERFRAKHDPPSCTANISAPKKAIRQAASLVEKFDANRCP